MIMQYLIARKRISFYHTLLPNLAGGNNIHAWTIPHVSLSSLTSGSIDPASRQRVDFLICHPNGTNFVVEIDGLQHTSSKELDRQRDQVLMSEGIDVIRIPASEVRAESGKNLEILSENLKAVPETMIDIHRETLHRAIFLAKASGQIQIALLQAVKTGFITLEEGSKCRMYVQQPLWLEDIEIWKELVKATVEDFISLYASIYRLHTGIETRFSFSILYHPEYISKVPNLDIQILFGPTEMISSTGKVLRISKSFTPKHIAKDLPVSPPLTNLAPDFDTVKFLLYYIFRKDNFLDGQWDTIHRTLQGLDSIVLLPTGGGKSIAFQLASLLLPGPCLVIDPLIALINDQIDNLRDAGIDRVVGITSQLSPSDKEIALNAFARGNFIFCYVAPERLQMEDFREALRGVTAISPISIVAIDEAHCVSEWGHDFRTNYLNIARNARNFCSHKGYIPPILGLTGTASRSVLKDVQRELGILDFDAIVTPTSLDRPELKFRVVHCHSSEKQARLRGYLASLPSQFGISSNAFFQPRGKHTMSGLIFYPHVNGDYGIMAGYKELKAITGSIGLYSGKAPKGVSRDRWDDMKTAFAEQFKHDDISVLVCTKAFGMGIDKPNIRYTVHMNLPRSIEAYYQEAGRAGRDHKISNCALIVSNDHPTRARRLLDPTTPINEIVEIVNGVSWEEADDIVRMMWFHGNAFRGVDEEIDVITDLIAEIGDLRERRTLSIGYTDETRNEREKAVHRLVILSVVEDYTNDYAHEQIKMTLSGEDKKTVLDAYVAYISSYNRRQANRAEVRAQDQIDRSFNEFIKFILRQLIEFIYSTVELGRRRSLAEMLQAATSGSSDMDIRRHILNYLELGQYSDLLDAARERSEDLPNLIQELIEQISSPNESAELRGQTAFLLESYPNNPALLFIRTLSELMSRDCSEQVLIDNFKAGIQYALSETGWALPITEVAETVGIFTEQAKITGSKLVPTLITVYLDAVDEPRNAAREIIRHTSLEVSAPVVEKLLVLLSKRIDTIVQHSGGEND